MVEDKTEADNRKQAFRPSNHSTDTARLGWRSRFDGHHLISRRAHSPVLFSYSLCTGGAFSVAARSRWIVSLISFCRFCQSNRADRLAPASRVGVTKKAKAARPPIVTLTMAPTRLRILWP